MSWRLGDSRLGLCPPIQVGTGGEMYILPDIYTQGGVCMIYTIQWDAALPLQK
jgi:hypothetical protein